MLRLSVWLSVLLLSSSLTALRAAPADKTAHLDDTAHLLPPKLGDMNVLEGRLADFERSSGIRILVELHEKSPSADEDKVPGAYMRALAEHLGTRQHGVLLVYFADDPDWRIWIGDDLTPAFAGKSGTVQELTDSNAIHDVKEALLASAHAKADAAFAALQKSALADQSPTPAQHLRLQTDALLDALIARFGLK